MRANWIGLALLLSACSRHESKPAPAVDSSASPPAAAAAPSARFSKPIAATRLPDGSVVVAGLVVASSSIVAMRVAADGSAAFAAPVFDGVTWSGGSELRLLPAPDGAAVVWRGLRGGKPVTELVRLGKAGEIGGAAVDVGAAACAIDDSFAWFEHGRDGSTRVRARPWSGSSVTDVLTIAGDRDPELVCAAHRLFGLGDGEDDVTVVSAAGLEAGAPAAILRDKDFEHDEEREHDVYTVGDSLGIVRVGESGTLSVRELGAGAPSAWRTLSRKVSRDEDVVTVDADATSIVIVFTREEAEGCGGSSALSVRAIRASRFPAGQAPAPETEVLLSPTVCARDLGPFWTGPLDGSFVVAWVERGHKIEPDAGPSAPISGLAWRSLPGDPSATLQGSVQRVDLPSDELVSAGCDHAHCYAAALVRPPGSDGMQPEAIRVLSFP